MKKKKKKKRGKNSNHMQAVKLIIKEILDKVFV
jgi:urease gamma subunit